MPSLPYPKTFSCILQNFSNNGCIQVFDEHLEQGELQNAKRICEELQVPHEILTADEVNERYKPFHVQQHCKTLVDTYGGTLVASKCLTVLQVSGFKNIHNFCLKCHHTAPERSLKLFSLLLKEMLLKPYLSKTKFSH